MATDDTGVFLRVHKGEEHIRDFPLEGNKMIIGRSLKVDITLESDGVSRKHAELARDSAGKWWVRDLYSANGTKVNRDQTMEHKLEIGDVIEIEDFSLLFRL